MQVYCLSRTHSALIHTLLVPQVYLELNVEVAKSWRGNKKALEEYGYFDAMYT